MPFDPTLPINNAQVQAAVLRAQFNGLFDLIQTIPVGPQGIPGVNGQDGVSAPPVTSFIVDAVNTLNPGDPATVVTTFDGTSVHFVFGLPRGSNGSDGGTGPAGPGVNAVVVEAVNTLNPGDNAQAGVTFDGSTVRFTFGLPRGFNGTDGNDGGVGPVGPQGQQGPPFASAIVDSVANLNPGEAPTVGVTFDGSNVRFAFGIPRGFNGNDGLQGLQGPPGEVSQSQLNSAIAGTSTNTNAVATLDTPFANDPPTLADLETMRAKVNELVLALRR